jgi:hypothetical protein
MAHIINRKGDVSITILVIGVFVICALAIVSFILFNQQVQNGFVNMGIFENLSAQVENYYFYINSGLSPQQAASNVGAQLQGNQLIFNTKQLTDSGTFGFIKGSNSDPIISIEYKYQIK